MRRALYAIFLAIVGACSHDSGRATTPPANLRAANAADEQNLSRERTPPPAMEPGAPTAAPPPMQPTAPQPPESGPPPK